MREAAVTSGIWVALGLSFGAVVWWVLGSTAAAQYFTGYVVEKSLSVDNVFVWAVIFGYFAVPAVYQHRVLFWGIFGALALRVGFVLAGVALLERLDWILYVFGAFLVVTVIRVARNEVGISTRRATRSCAACDGSSRSRCTSMASDSSLASTDDSSPRLCSSHS